MRPQTKQPLTVQEQYLRKHKSHHRQVSFLRFFLLGIFLLLWEVSADLDWIDSFFFSSPHRVILCLGELWTERSLPMHIGITLSETILSFLLVFFVSLLLSTLLWFSRQLSEILEPYLVLLYSLPKSALVFFFIVWVKTVIYTGHQLFADLGQGGVHIIDVVSGGIGNIAVAHKLAVAVIAADGERIDLFAQADQVLGLGSKGDVAGFAITIEQRADTDGVTRSDQPFFAAVVQNHGELGIQMIEHIQAVLVIQRQDDLAVRIRLKGVAISFQLFFDRAEASRICACNLIGFVVL